VSALLTDPRERETMPRMADRIKALGDSFDLFDGELARNSRSVSCRRSYRWTLGFLADDALRIGKEYANELILDDYERTLNRWTDLAPSTLAQRISCFRTYSKFLWRRGWADQWVCADMDRPRRPRAEDIDVVSVSSEDVMRMFGVTRDVQEFVCLATAVYLGARRHALSQVRRGDVDLVHGTVRFSEKGGKVIVKPLPREYQHMLAELDADGVWTSPDDYLIPNRRPRAVRRKERSDKIVWETVKTIAARANVTCHVHALRAAFAVAFDEAHPDQFTALQLLLGHSRPETTLVYLRRKNKARAMEAVHDLSWGAATSLASTLPLSSDAVEAHTGFEPVPPP
jgi:integrase